VCELRRERNGSRLCERRRERGEDAGFGVERDPLKSWANELPEPVVQPFDLEGVIRVEHDPGAHPPGKSGLGLMGRS